MALIELNLEKPAFKRVESTATETTDERARDANKRDSETMESRRADTASDETTNTARSDETTNTTSEEKETSGRRPGRTMLLGTVIVGVLGLVTFRKLRKRQRSEP